MPPQASCSESRVVPCAPPYERTADVRVALCSGLGSTNLRKAQLRLHQREARRGVRSTDTKPDSTTDIGQSVPLVGIRDGEVGVVPTGVAGTLQRADLQLENSTW